MEYYDDELYHHGIKGMKWGIRRYQNFDGTLTPKGKKRYGDKYYDNGKMKILKTDSRLTRRVKDDYNNLTENQFYKKYRASRDTYSKRVMKYGDPYMNSPYAKLGKALTRQRTFSDAKTRRKQDEENALQELKEIRKNKPLRKKPYRDKDLETIRTQPSFNKKSVNAGTRYLAKKALKRAGVGAAVGLGGGYYLARKGYRGLGRALATGAGAYTASTLVNGLSTAAVNKIAGEGYLKAKAYVKKRNRRKDAARRKAQGR